MLKYAYIAPIIYFRGSIELGKGKALMIRPTHSRRKNRSWPLILLILPFMVLLYPPFYNYLLPEFIGIPFFYWFQLLWIFITAIITAVVYLLEA